MEQIPRKTTKFSEMKRFLIYGLLLLASASAAPKDSYGLKECLAASDTDTDHDGLSDQCEFALASQFAPTLVVRSGGCNWDDSMRPGQLAGGYFFAVQAIGPVVRIAYLPAYFRDCGWKGIKCSIPGVNCSPHEGDSEFMVVEVLSDSESFFWSATGIFLSAHCFGRSDPSCRWYRGSELQKFEWVESSPLIWVAEGRNANYPTQRACDRGHHALDSCDRNDSRYRFPIRMDHNIGSRAWPAGTDGCISGADLGQASAASDRLECFWSETARFHGWQSTGRGVTGYSRYLREIAGF